ncbi:MAG: hypothetical protein Q4G49_14165 [Paracoccus sp. (in: a-proteobacteria)]|nr:hypothetical protein [Paracoccus sp. (in: a-proteobacteria)]
MHIYFTALKATDKNNPPVKTYGWQDGALTKKLAYMASQYSVAGSHVQTMAEFRDALERVTCEEAFLYGMPKDKTLHNGTFLIVPEYQFEEIRTALEGRWTAVTRTKAEFAFASQPGIMLIDVDGIVGNHDAQIQKIYEVAPELKDYPHVVQPSSSSNLRKPDGSELSGVKGLHLYWFVDDATRIKEYGHVLFDRLTLAGHSHVKISASGSMLERSVVDAAVWQGERLDFVGGAALRDGLTYSDRTPELRGERQDGVQIVPGSVFKPLTPAERKAVDKFWTEEKTRLKREQRRVEEVSMAARSIRSRPCRLSCWATRLPPPERWR